MSITTLSRFVRACSREEDLLGALSSFCCCFSFWEQTLLIWKVVLDWDLFFFFLFNREEGKGKITTEENIKRVATQTIAVIQPKYQNIVQKTWNKEISENISNKWPSQLREYKQLQKVVNRGKAIGSIRYTNLKRSLNSFRTLARITTIELALKMARSESLKRSYTTADKTGKQEL